jgi:hypothetical protein
MSRNLGRKIAFKLLFLIVMGAGIVTVLSDQNATTVSASTCDTEFSSCIYLDCLVNSTPSVPFPDCQDNCDLQFEGCALDPSQDPSPQPMPIIDRKRAGCASACDDLYGYPTFGSPEMEAKMACYNWCDETFPKY